MKIIRILPFLLPICATAALPTSGVYSGASIQPMVAFDPTTQQVSGYIHEHLEGADISCTTYFSGKMVGDKASFETYFPGDLDAPKMETIHATLTVTPAVANTFTVDLDSSLPGSMACQADKMEANGHSLYEFELGEAVRAHANWKSIRVVRIPKAHFYRAADESQLEKAYIVRGDGVGVLNEQGDWLNVEFIDGGKPITGWMHTKDFYRQR